MTRTGSNRRGFLKGSAGGLIGAGAFAGGVGGLAVAPARAQEIMASDLELMAHPTVSGDAGSDAYWQEVRQAFPLPDDYIHMNTGTTGSQPTFSLNNLLVYNQYKSMDPLHWQQNLASDYPDLFPIAGTNSISPRQAAIAEMYGANEDEMVLTYNTSDALLLIFSGTPWQPGDRIVTSNLEHGAMINPMRFVRDHFGVEISVVQIPSNFTSDITLDDVVGLFEEALSAPLPNGAKQYLAISEITYKNGLRLPVKALVEAARENGAYSIVDSAHAWGMIPVDSHDYGADFIAGAGHKWLCGGPGTGILYVRNQGEDLPPFAGSMRNYNENQFGNRDWSPASQMQGRGEFNRPALLAMADTAAFFDHVGLEAIYERGVALSNYLKDKVADKWGAEALFVQKNDEPEFATFLTAFNPFVGKDDAGEFGAMDGALTQVINALSADDPKIYIRTISWIDDATIDSSASNDRVGFRVSTHAMYNDEEQIDLVFDRLVEAVDAVEMNQLGA